MSEKFWEAVDKKLGAIVPGDVNTFKNSAGETYKSFDASLDEAEKNSLKELIKGMETHLQSKGYKFKDTDAMYNNIGPLLVKTNNMAVEADKTVYDAEKKEVDEASPSDKPANTAKLEPRMVSRTRLMEDEDEVVEGLDKPKLKSAVDEETEEDKEKKKALELEATDKPKDTSKLEPRMAPTRNRIYESTMNKASRCL